jgi:hypothetical protein
MEDSENTLRKGRNAKVERDSKLDRKIMRGGKMMVALSGRNIMEQVYQFLTDNIFMIDGKFFNSMKDDRVCEDGGVKRMGSVNG